MAENQALHSFLKRALIPFYKVLLSRSNHHPHTPTYHLHCTGILIWTWRFWGDIISRRWQGRTSEKYAVTFQTPGNNTACLASLIRYWVSFPWWVNHHAVCMARPTQVMWRYLASDGGVDTVQVAGLQEQGRNEQSRDSGMDFIPRRFLKRQLKANRLENKQANLSCRNGDVRIELGGKY